MEEADENDLRQAVIGAVQAGVFTLTATAFLAWLYRAYRNLDALSPDDRSWRPGWAVGAWFVPILNLWRPKQIVNELWRGSGASRSGRVPPWLAVWWGLWLLAGFLYNGGLRLSLRADDVSELVTAGRVTLAADAASLPAALLTGALLVRVTAAQGSRASAAGLAPEEPRSPLYRRRSAWASLAGLAAALALQGGLGYAVWSGSLSTVEDDAADADDVVVFSDDFSNPLSGWLVDADEMAEMGYREGRYFIHAKEPLEMHSFQLLTRKPLGMRLEVEARLDRGTAEDGFGLACWTDERGRTGYTAALFQDGFHAIAEYRQGSEDAFVLAEGSRERPARRGVTLRFECVRQARRVRLTLFVDGRRRARVYDESDLLGDLTGLGMFTASESGDTEATFDDFSMRELDR